jgi:hypothetical protein
MAIYSAVPPPEQQATIAVPTAGVDIEAWTVSALQAIAISAPVRGTNSNLSIPLDGRDDDTSKAAYKARKEPLQRDSMKRREALLKGKEGSRRRQRWENGERTLKLAFQNPSSGGMVEVP